MGFATPLLLLGLLGIAAPIAAHLMRRRDLPIVALATVMLLERARAKSRKRMHLVDLLLLAVRIALVAALAIALADPYVSARLAYGDGRIASLAIVLDDSMSMERTADDRGTGTPLSETARSIAREAIASLPRGSEVTVVLAGDPVRVLVPRTEELESAIHVLEEAGTPPSARGTDVPGGVARATRELAAARVDTRRLLLITDGAAHAHLENVRWPDDDIGYEVRRLSGGHGNRAIVSAHAVPDPTTPDHVSIAVEVRSFDAPGATHVRLMMGDEQVARETVDLSTGTARVTLHAPIRDDGEPSARLVLEGRDALSVDDARAVLLRPNGALRVLLVDGDPHPNRDRDEVGYLARALDLSPPDAGLISYRVVDSDTAEALDLAAWDVIVLANVRVPSAHASERLVRFVEGGGGLLVSAGDRVDPASYQARLGTILPGRPRAISGAPAPLTLTRDEAADVRDDSLPTSEGLEGVRVTRRLLIEPSATARIPLRFADTTPALVVGGDAGGRVALLAIPVDTAWSDLPYRPGFLPLVIELLIHLGPTARLPENAVAPGTPVTVPVPSGADRVVVLTPDGVRHEGAPHQALVLEDTSAPGAYRVMAFTEGAPHDTEPDAAFLVAPRAEESDLRDAEVQTEEAGVVIDGEGHDGGAIVRRSIAVWFFLFAGILAVLEALLRSRRPFATA